MNRHVTPLVRWIRLAALGWLLAVPPRALADDAFHRAGHPECVASWAAPTNTCRYSGGYVGGGSATHGDVRRPGEGTWGRDYRGHRGLRRIWLTWSHGRRCQGGTGSYHTD